MTDHAQPLLEEARCVSLKDEPATLRPQWEATLRDRIDDLAEGRVEAVPWQDVEARLRRTLARR